MPGSSVDASDPQLAQIALAVATVAVGILQGTDLPLAWQGGSSECDCVAFLWQLAASWRGERGRLFLV